MTMGHKVALQLWIGSTDVNGMLLSVGGWHVGSYAALEAGDAVKYAEDRGWVQKRTHHGPAWPKEGVAAYELTDAGLQQIEDSYGPPAKANAETTRQWYRDSALRHGPMLRNNSLGTSPQKEQRGSPKSLTRNEKAL